MSEWADAPPSREDMERALDQLRTRERSAPRSSEQQRARWAALLERADAQTQEICADPQWEEYVRIAREDRAAAQHALETIQAEVRGTKPLSLDDLAHRRTMLVALQSRITAIDDLLAIPESLRKAASQE